MTNPIMTITTFKSGKSTSKVAYTTEIPLYGDVNFPEAIDGLIELRANPDYPKFLTISEYADEHTAESWRAGSGLMFEVEAIEAQKLMDALADTMWAHILVDTETPMSNRVAAIIPFTEPVTDANEYIMLASRFVKFLGVYNVTKGSEQVTFQVSLQPTGRSYFVNGTILNPTTFMQKHRRTYAKMVDYVGPRPVSKIAMPSFAKPSVGKMAAKAQLAKPDNTDNSGLFEF